MASLTSRPLLPRGRRDAAPRPRCRSSARSATSASSRPCVTQTLGAPTSFRVCGQLGPVGMVGDDQRQLGAALAGAGAYAHPARGHRRHRIGEAARPAVGDRRGRAEHDGALEGLEDRVRHQRDVAEIDAVLLVELAQRGERAVQPDALVVARGAQQPDHPLALAQRIDAHQVSAFGKGRDASAAACRSRPSRRDDGTPAGRRSPR